MNSNNARTCSKDLIGGMTAAMTALPVELVYGLFAVAPMGTAFASHGLRAALLCCILGGIIGFTLRTTGGMITGSRPAAALILGTLAANLLSHVDIQATVDPAGTTFLLVLLCTVLAGVFQYLFGLAGVGRALKFVPYPVIAGLMCGVGLLMLLAALRPALGMPFESTWSQFQAAWHPGSLIVALTTLAICFAVPRWTKRIPGPIVALVFGSLIHHLIAGWAGVGQLGATATAINSLLPEYTLFSVYGGMGLTKLLSWLPTLAPYALAIAAFASLETLLCLAAIETATNTRPEGDRELRLHGIGNLLGGMLGATPAIGNLSRVMVNLSSGGHSPVSGLGYTITLAIVILVFGNWIGFLPNAVTAGILIFYAYAMIDDGTRRLFTQVMLQRGEIPPAQYRVLRDNLIVIVLVALIAVFGDMMKAVGVGVAAAMILFVRTSMKPVIRRVFNVQQHRSLKVRTLEARRVLENNGHQIAVIDAEGPLFFGTADRLASEIERVGGVARWINLDLKRVRDVDPTGARTLLLVARKMKAHGKTLSLSAANQRVEAFLGTMGLEGSIPCELWFCDLDSALERLEDFLLATHALNASLDETSLADTELTADLSTDEIHILAQHLRVHEFKTAGPVFTMGATGDSLYVASGSAVDIVLSLAGKQPKRLASFAPGTVFGEMAMLGGHPRSADAILLGPGTVWELSRETLGTLEQDHPAIAQTILRNIGKSLADRLRLTTTELRLALEG